MKRSRLIARIAVFSALAYVFAYASFFIPNMSLIFIVVFASGAIDGLRSGIIVGGAGMFLWTVFNPYGMAPVATTAAQIAGMMLVGGLGGIVHSKNIIKSYSHIGLFYFALYGLISGMIFQLVVNGVDAWLYGPFWQYLLGGLTFSLMTIVFNTLAFPVFYPIIVKMNLMERKIER